MKLAATQAQHPRLVWFAVVAILVGLGLPVAVPRAAVAATFTDMAGNPYAADVDWIAARGITGGCDLGRFCPKAPVTRAQMASFVVRLFRLPGVATDYFADDESSLHEPDINAVAGAGVTAGCAANTFCPGAWVTREQMASFIARAAKLPSASADYFIDDERSRHEGDVNRLAGAGVSTGCGGIFEFCARSVVTREQMAAFLHRVGTGGGTPPKPPPGGTPPKCAYEDRPTARATYADWSTSLLDTTYMLPANYRPSDLVDTGAAGLNAGYTIRAHVVRDLAALATAAMRAGAPLRVVSGFRSYSTQQATFDYWVRVGGLDMALATSARAGHSEHQLGTTVDFASRTGPAPWTVADWGASPAGAWMRQHAWRYGFVMSYPPGSRSVTCYASEPWHYRYVGRLLASKIHTSGLTLREWLWRVYAS